MAAQWSHAEWATYMARWTVEEWQRWEARPGGKSPTQVVGGGQGKGRGHWDGDGKGRGHWGGQGKGRGHRGGQADGGGKGKGGGTPQAQADGGGKGKGGGHDKGQAEQGGQGKGKGVSSSSGGSGGQSPLGMSGQEFLQQKGDKIKNTFKENQWKAPETAPQRRRQARSAWYAASTGGESLGPEEIAHQLSVPWPHSYKDMGAEFMSEWRAEAEARGFSLRLTTWRNSMWKDNPELCASQYRLRITGKSDRPNRDAAVEIIFLFAEAAKKLLLAPSTLPWQQIIEWWDGKDSLFCLSARGKLV